MKIGSAVLGLHIAALIAFSLTQGCVTTESQGSGRGAGAKHKGPFKHEHKGKASSTQPVAASDSIYPGDEQSTVYDPVIIDSGTASGSVAPVVVPVTTYDNTETYIVQKGDMLSRLAVDFNTSTKTLIAMNNLSNPDVLYVGQELRVPAGSRRSAPTKKAPSVKKGGEYVIQKGDTLSGIAAAAGVSLADLRSLNNIEGDRIIAGETLSIPSGGKVPTDTQKSKPKEADPVEPAPEPAPLAGSEPVASDSMQVDSVMDHVVYPGETLDDISRQYGVSKSDIIRMNSSISDESAVKEGQRLRIPITE